MIASQVIHVTCNDIGTAIYNFRSGNATLKNRCCMTKMSVVAEPAQKI